MGRCWTRSTNKQYYTRAATNIHSGIGEAGQGQKGQIRRCPQQRLGQGMPSGRT